MIMCGTQAKGVLCSWNADWVRPTVTEATSQLKYELFVYWIYCLSNDWNSPHTCSSIITCCYFIHRARLL